MDIDTQMTIVEAIAELNRRAKRIAELERWLEASPHKLAIELSEKARADERGRCLKAKPEAPEIVLEPFTDDAHTQWACGYEAALDDWEKEIRALCISKLLDQ